MVKKKTLKGSVEAGPFTFLENDMKDIKQFLYRNCIDGIEFVPLSEQEREEAESWERETKYFYAWLLDTNLPSIVIQHDINLISAFSMPSTKNNKKIT